MFNSTLFQKIYFNLKHKYKVKYILSFLALIFILTKQNFYIENVFSAPYPHFLVLALLSNYLKFMFSTHRFNMLMNSQKLKVKFKETLEWTFQSRFLDTLSPTSFASDFVKLFSIKALFPHKSTQHNFMIIMIDKLIAFAALFLLSLITFILGSVFYGLFGIQNQLINLQYANLFLLAACIGSLLLFLGLFLSRDRFVLKLNNTLVKTLLDLNYFNQVVRQCIFILALAQRNSRKLISIVTSAIFAQICAILSLLFVLYAFNIELNLLSFFFIIPLAFISNMLGFMGGIGTGTLGIGFCLSYILGIENAYFLVLLNQSINLFSKIPFVFVYLKTMKKDNRNFFDE